MTFSPGIETPDHEQRRDGNNRYHAPPAWQQQTHDPVLVFILEAALTVRRIAYAMLAFANEEAVLTFECYMEMVSGRNRVAEDCEIDDSDLEQSVGPYQSIFGDV